MLEDKVIWVRHLRKGFKFFKSMAQLRGDLETAKTASRIDFNQTSQLKVVQSIRILGPR